MILGCEVQISACKSDLNIQAYVRVLRPAHASMIIEGLNNEESEDAIKAELLVDKQEEIYWMKLPEKVRG